MHLNKTEYGDSGNVQHRGFDALFYLIKKGNYYVEFIFNKQ